MAEKNGKWVTVNGRHIFIPDGKKLEDVWDYQNNGPKEDNYEEDLSDYESEDYEKDIDELSMSGMTDEEKEIYKAHKDEIDGDLDEDKNQYVIKTRDDISKATDKKAFEYISNNIDELTEAGLISEEMSDKLYEELDAKIDESRNNDSAEEYKPFEGKHNYLVNRMYNSAYDTPEEVYEDAKTYNLSEKEKWGLDEEVKKVFGLTDEELEKVKKGPDTTLSEEEIKSGKRAQKEKKLKDLLNKNNFNISTEQLNSMSDGEINYLIKKVKDFEDVMFNSSKYKNANEVLDKIIKSIWKKTDK